MPQKNFELAITKVQNYKIQQKWMELFFDFIPSRLMISLWAMYHY